MPWFGPGFGWGRGRGWRWCWWFGFPGRGWGWRWWWAMTYLGESYPEITKNMLKTEAEILRRNLELIEKRLAELEKSSQN